MVFLQFYDIDIFDDSDNNGDDSAGNVKSLYDECI